MITEALKKLFTRELNRVCNELELYNDENAIWKTGGAIANSAGNLCLHLAGNLNTYIGNQIANTGYERNREAEFSLKDIPREQLLVMLRNTIETVTAALDELDDSMLEKEHPFLVFEKKTSTGYLLVHLINHLGYHLGQINYHRRLIDA